MTSRRRTLRTLVEQKQGLVVPGAYDGVSARLVEPLISYLKKQNLLFVRPKDALTSRVNLSMEMYYALTEQTTRATWRRCSTCR